MSLPLPAIDWVFSRLLATYGRQFADLYADLNPGDVKTAWCHELAPFGRDDAGMNRIAWALENLPDRAPNAIQFRNLCRQAPAEIAPPLTMPAANPERVRAELAKLGHVDKAKRMPVAGGHNPKAWAQRWVDADAAGHKVRPITLLFSRQALGLTREAAPMRGGSAA